MLKPVLPGLLATPLGTIFHISAKENISICLGKDIRPQIFLFNFKLLTKNYTLDILMIYNKELLSANFIICDGHWKNEN